jgi:hypothetical protein
VPIFDPDRELEEEVIDSSTPRPPKERFERPRKSAQKFGINPGMPQKEPRKRSEKGEKFARSKEPRSKFDREANEEKYPRNRSEKDEKLDREPRKTFDKEAKPEKQHINRSEDHLRKPQEVEDAIVTVPESIVVKQSENDMRLDRFLGKRFPHLPNSLIQRLVREKRVFLV